MAPLKPATSYTSCSLHEPVKMLASEQNLKETKPQTIPEFFHDCCGKFKNSTALAYKDNSETWITITYEEYEKNVEQAALVLLHLGVQLRTSVGILAHNCPEWFYINLAAMRINAVSAGIYTTNSPEVVFHVLETSNASVVVVDDSGQLEKIRKIRTRLPQLKAVIQLHEPFDFGEDQQKEGYYRWRDLFEMQFTSSLREELRLREGQVAANECALIIFTSGTVGMPKGCMISHDAMVYLTKTMNHNLTYINKGHERIVSYLPLNHVAGQLFDTFMTMDNGAATYFADRNALKGTLIENFIEVQPTFLFGVPRVFEKIYEKLMQLEDKSSTAKKCLLQTARGYMREYHVNRTKGKPTSSVKYWLASKVIHRIKDALGLGDVKDCFIGGAPSSEDVKNFFMSLDLPLTDIYGMSEVSGAVVFNFGKSLDAGLGKPLNGVEVQVRNPSCQRREGEVMMRGRTNFMGYLKEPGKTKDTVTSDGWILSGDFGYLNAQGNLFICGRLKELIVTAGGENIPPIHIEDIIKKELPCLSNGIVIGDGRKYLTALMTFKTDMDPHSGYPLETLLPETKEWLNSLDLHYTQLSEIIHIKLPKNLENFDPDSIGVKLDDKLHRALEAGIQRYNQQAISNAQKIQYFTVLPHDFSIPTGELGPTLKMRRSIVQQKYAKIIDKMYNK
ncbi:long-chain-fatty-acid--CoA ligase heimdall-like [Musca autumnalis]|uniref:long-chain-fatty-acid--CoA ligase heimdall-like n=1 Tax=Musca autumnalis TaxID=221902 RepID=UPI003CE9CFBC